MNSMKKLMILLFAASLALSIAVNTNAALIVDTGAPTNTWGAWSVVGWGESGKTSQWLAGQFTLKQTYDIYAMQGYLSVNVQDDVRITIYNDNQGTPGASLFSKTFMSQTDQYPNFYGWQGTSGYAGRLDAGTYWIAFEVPTGSSFEGGMGNSAYSPVMAVEATKTNMGGDLGWSNWVVYPDYGPGVYARIEGSPVPLPGAFWLLGPGLVGLAAIRIRLKK